MNKKSNVKRSNNITEYFIYNSNDASGKSKVNIKLLDNNRYGTSNAYYVLINNRDKAYLKTSKNKYVDDIDVSISQFGSLFGIDITKICKMEDSNSGTGILSYDIKTDTKKQYLSLYDAYFSYYLKYKQGQIRNLKWITELLSLPKGSKEKPLNREEDIKVVIDMAINILKDELNIDDKRIDEVRKQYFRILLFDYFTNQTDRSLGNINLVLDKDKIYFAPLYDNGYVYNEEIGVDNIVLLDYICSRETFIKTMFKYYFRDIKDDIKLYLDKDTYMNKVNNILKINLNKSNYNWYFNIINNNADRIISLYNQYKDIDVEVSEKNTFVDLRLQYGYVRIFSVLLSTLFVLLIIVILLRIFI